VAGATLTERERGRRHLVAVARWAPGESPDRPLASFVYTKPRRHCPFRVVLVDVDEVDGEPEWEYTWGEEWGRSCRTADVIEALTRWRKRDL